MKCVFVCDRGLSGNTVNFIRFMCMKLIDIFNIVAMQISGYLADVCLV